MKLIQQQFQIDKLDTGLRLDQALHHLLPDYSRSRIQEWIQQGFVSLNQKPCKPKQKVFRGDLVDLDVPEQVRIVDKAQSVAFEIIYQDEDVFVINKPANLVVHPAAGHEDGTLVNGLLELDPRLDQLPRAGVVHRLDKDTTGVMVVARNLPAHNWLVEQLQQRRVKREYVAIAQGVITAGRTIDSAITRHPLNRKKMSVQPDGKPAITHFQVATRFRHYSLINVQLETGRTHQIRVHMAYIRHALLGDSLYGGRLQLPSAIDEVLSRQIQGFKRQALHAHRLSFEHPRSQQMVSFEAPLARDFQQMLDTLKHHD